MKYGLLVLIMTFFSGLAFSQDKVKWTVTYNEAEKQIEFRADIAEGWHLYSQFIQNDIGPVPTAFVFNDNSRITRVGKVAEPTPIHAYDENFEASLDFFKDKAVFTQKVAPGSKGVVSGYITYMICNEIMCLPPVDVEFTITIP
jgi:hypothetical protein